MSNIIAFAIGFVIGGLGAYVYIAVTGRMK